jgi:hypothetical protein
VNDDIEQAALRSPAFHEGMADAATGKVVSRRGGSFIDPDELRAQANVLETLVKLYKQTATTKTQWQAIDCIEAAARNLRDAAVLLSYAP